MKNLFLIVFLLLCQSTFSQSTWIKTHDVNSFPPYLFVDSTDVGPYEIKVCPNGTIMCMSLIDAGYHEVLTAFDSLGQTLWDKATGHYQGNNNKLASDLHVTKDNGCVYRLRQTGQFGWDSICRVNAAGVIIWAQYYNYFNSPLLIPVNGLTQSAYNTTLIQFQDSLIEVDSLGTLIQSRAPISSFAKFYSLPDSTFIRVDNSIIVKETFAGSSFWSMPSTAFPVVSDAVGSTIYMADGTHVSRMEWATGNILWSLPLTSRKIITTHDEGVLINDGYDLFKYDSTGALQWTKNYTLPNFGFTSSCQLPDNTYITGGSWVRHQISYTDIYYGFVTRIDESGNGVCDSTNFYYPGNANDNNVLSFSDDAVFVAAAIGNSGPPMEQLLQTDSIVKSTCGTDWATGFAAGYNHKFSDANGDGVIDAIDVFVLNNLPFAFAPFNQVSPHWLKTAMAPEIKFSVSNNHLTEFDTLAIDVILGSPSLQIDSIYGLSIELYFDTLKNGNAFNRSFTLPTTAFGDSSVNLYNFNSYKANDLAGHTRYVFCRKNHTNTSLAGDTIARLYFDLGNLPLGLDTIIPFAKVNAITEGGFPVSLSVSTDSVFVSGITSINNVNKPAEIFYPNPIHDNIYYTATLETRISIMDVSGRICTRTIAHEGTTAIDLSSLSEGVYFLVYENKERTSRIKFIKIK